MLEWMLYFPHEVGSPSRSLSLVTQCWKQGWSFRFLWGALPQPSVWVIWHLALLLVPITALFLTPARLHASFL